MAKSRRVFVCRGCGGMQSRWMGKCPDCNAWDSLEEQVIEKSAGKDPQRGLIESWQAGAVGAEGEEAEAVSASGAPVAKPIAEVGSGGAPVPRITTGIGEFDRVLGGGLVPGSVVLVGGDPGIGKSTLLLQAAGKMGGGRSDGVTKRRGDEVKTAAGGLTWSLDHSVTPSVLYVSSEESAEQVRMRGARLGVGDAPGLFVLSDTNLARIVEQTRRVMPRVLVIDSVQMIYKADLDASPGSIAQLRRCCAELVYLAKVSNIAVVLVGHVTKDGQIAGPRLLEHLVDAVLYFEGDRYHAHRVLRGVKNRFGTTLEIGIFEMTGAGMREVPGGLGVGVLDPTGSGGKKVGAVVCPTMTGTRCVLVELQALTATGFLGAVKRKSSGLDANRLAMIIAVLEQHAELRLADRDVFASSVGGIRVVEPATDLALLMAIAGAHYRRSLEPGTAVVGEVGLGGEVRAVTQIEQRIVESGRLGFKRIIVPRLSGKMREAIKPPPGVTLDSVGTINEAIERLG